MVFHQAVARRGVRTQLAMALCAIGVAMLCLGAVFLWPQTQFALAALALFGLCAITLAVAALLSARREEAVHRLAHQLGHVAQLEDKRGIDGSV